MSLHRLVLSFSDFVRTISFDLTIVSLWFIWERSLPTHYAFWKIISVDFTDNVADFTTFLISVSSCLITSSFERRFESLQPSISKGLRTFEFTSFFHASSYSVWRRLTERVESSHYLYCWFKNSIHVVNLSCRFVFSCN